MSKIPKRILAKIQEVKKKQLKELNLSCDWNTPEDQKLSEIPPEVFELEQLEVLNLRHNSLTTLPDSIIQLQNLTNLYLSNNQLTAVPNSIVHLYNLTKFDLSDNQLSKIPDWISQLQNLTLLGLGGSQLTVVPDWISQLQNLTDLDLSSNQLTRVPNWISELQYLSYLDLRNNKLTTVPYWISQLQNLRGLHLSNNQLASIPEWISQLQRLQFLGLNGSQLTTIPEWISQLQNLRGLYLSDNQLTSIPEWISQSQNLKQLDLSNNQLTTIPEWISQLQNLTNLYLSKNKLTTIPESISHLQNLTVLYLYENQLTKVPDSIFKLKNLKSLSLWGNQIKEISPKMLQLKNLKELNLRWNPIEHPPMEVAEQGVEAIKAYFRQLEAEGKDYLYEAKLLIIGEPGAGKTTLVKKVENPNYELQDEDSTRGIDVIRWEFHIANGQPFRVNIWDFGGQEIYKATHQFFLTKRSLYALVADTRKEDTDFYYWLNVVELLSDNSPLLIIKNEKKDRQREINERQLRGQFTNLEKTLATNLATNRGLPEIISEIKHYVTHLPHVGVPLPKTWTKVREALEKDSRNYISLDEYLTICQQNGFSQLKDKLQLSGYLHDLGVCLHFQDDPLLKKTVILKPEWGTVAVYKVLDNKTVINRRGRFSRADLTNIWHEDQYTIMQDELLQLMMKFKLCYQIPSSSDYIAPQLLTENQPAYNWDETDNLRLRYTYGFMPKGILTRFIVAMHNLIANQRYVWKSGIILKKDQTTAKVIEHYGKREITIQVVGKHKKELLTIITYELDKIHDSYRRLKYDKLIPCNCAQCKANPEPHFYRFEILRKFVDDRQPHIQCQHSYQMVEVLGLVDDVMDRAQVFRREREFERIQPDYDIKRIRTLLTEGFSEAELRQLCYDETDFKPVYEELSQVTGKADIVSQILEYAERKELMDTLLNWAKANNPAKYEKLEPYY